MKAINPVAPPTLEERNVIALGFLIEQAEKSLADLRHKEGLAVRALFDSRLKAYRDMLTRIRAAGNSGLFAADPHRLTEAQSLFAELNRLLQ